ncbi:hypothetical protein N483_16105 [Pseudoalteromonas luteoviolacea NCIMB 1944]|nr:hypothetical protein N483_16105 [Pseudoalteromonas luteoviolacea NCIMB 1944]
MGYSLKSVLLIFMIFSLVAAGVNLSIIVSSHANKNEHEYWLIHTYEVIDLISQLKVHVKNAETGQRGFLLTQNMDYLEPFRKGTNLSLSTFEVLMRKTADNPTQQKRLAELDVILNKKFSELEQTIELLQHATKQEAVDLVKTDLGKHLMEEIELVLFAFEQEERNLLSKRTREYQDAKRLLSSSIVMLELVYAILIIWLIYSIWYKVLKPISVLVSYIKHYPEVTKFEIAQQDNCEEVSELARGIKSRCSESEAVISTLQKSEKEAVEKQRLNLRGVAEYNDAIKTSLQSLFAALHKHKTDGLGSISKQEIESMVRLVNQLLDLTKDLDIYLKTSRQNSN